MNHSSVVRAGAVCAAAGALILTGMMVIGGGAAEALAILGQPGTPEQYAAAIRPGAETLLRVMALDNLFLIAYTGAFIGVAALVWEKARLFALTGLGFAILLALLDVSENSVTADMARAVGVHGAAIGNVPIPGWEISALGLLEQVKFVCGTLGVVFLGLGLWVSLPRKNFSFWRLGIFLFFPVVNALKVANLANALPLVLWMLFMLLVIAEILWREGRAAS